MKKIFSPVEMSESEQKILKEEAISWQGFNDITNKKIDYGDMNELMMMDYLTKKQKMIQLKIKQLQEKIQIFNENVSIMKNMNIHQNIVGEPLKKINLDIEYIYDW